MNKKEKVEINETNQEKTQAQVKPNTNKGLIIGLVCTTTLLVALIGGYTAYSLFNNNGINDIKITSDTSTTTNTSSTSNSSSKTKTTSTEITGNYTAKISLSDLSSSGSGVTISDNTITITAGGTYYLTGTSEDANIVVNAQGEDVILVLDNVNLTSKTTSCINVIKAESVTIYLKEESKNTLTDTSSYTVFTSETNDEPDATIYSKADLIFDGEGLLTINANYDKAIHGKDSLQILNGTYVITSKDDAIKGKDYVYIKDGTFTITAGGDGINSDNEEDTSLGYITIDGGIFTIKAGSDGIQSITNLTINDGTYTINAGEALESTLVTINGGKLEINASDDGINASNKSTIGTPTITIDGGDITINMAQGDTDALDANGNLYINGGTVNINAQFAFDYDKEGKLNGGTVYVNGSQVTEITESMQVGGGMQMGGPNSGMTPPNMGQNQGNQKMMTR